MRIPRIVLDTASFISGIRSDTGAASELLRLIVDQRVVIVMDLKLSFEYRDVALRSEHLEASGTSPEEMLRFLSILENGAEAVEGVNLLRPISVDPNDEMIIELAVAASVDAIVSNNIRHFGRIPETFGILILTPGAFLASLRKESS